jgi:pimeloyl-ACP methyl ester carboxylesterase
MIIVKRPPYTPELRDYQYMYPASIACLEKMKIGGVDQWILIRGYNRFKPLLLFLHGGPGTAQIAFARKFQAELERKFVVVNWDQRGAGKSRLPAGESVPMDIGQHVSDTLELVCVLLQRFNREKVYLAGHSWGSIIGLKAAYLHPELFHAYIGIGQVVNVQETGRILYQYTMEAAHRKKKRKAIAELEIIGYPPRVKNSHNAMLQIKWLERLGGVFNKPHLKREILGSILLSPEYTLEEKINYNVSSWNCFCSVFDELLQVNLPEQIPQVEVPSYFCVGRHDYNTPFELVEKYYTLLKAPRKHLYWFDHSGHAPHFEEPEKFMAIMSEIVSETCK